MGEADQENLETYLGEYSWYQNSRLLVREYMVALTSGMQERIQRNESVQWDVQIKNNIKQWIVTTIVQYSNSKNNGVSHPFVGAYDGERVQKGHRVLTAMPI